MGDVVAAKKTTLGEALKKIPLTPTEQALVKCCVAGKTKLNMEEIASSYGKAIKKPAKEDSVRSKLSVIRGKFKEYGGITFPASWEPKGDGPGGGRRVERVDALTALNGLDFGDLDLEIDMVETVGGDDSTDDDEGDETPE